MESLKEAEQRFEMVFERAAVGMNIVSLDGRFLRVNPAYCRLMGYTPEQLSTMTIFEISDPDDIDPTRAQYDDLIAGDIDEYQMDKQLRRADGIWIWARISASIVRDEAGRPLYAIGLVTDITDTRELADRLEHAATHDYLTGLAVRSVLHDHLERSLALARRTNEPVAVLVVDLDGFKMVNDTRGHAAGDAVLVESARRLESLVRATDLVVRLGGDEFVLVLAPSSDPASAVEIARRIVTALATEFVVAGRKVRIGASVGLAYSLGVESADDAARRRRRGAVPRRRARGGGRSPWPSTPARRLAGVDAERQLGNHARSRIEPCLLPDGLRLRGVVEPGSLAGRPRGRGSGCGRGRCRPHRGRGTRAGSARLRRATRPTSRRGPVATATPGSVHRRRPARRATRPARRGGGRPGPSLRRSPARAGDPTPGAAGRRARTRGCAAIPGCESSSARNSAAGTTSTSRSRIATAVADCMPSSTTLISPSTSPGPRSSSIVWRPLAAAFVRRACPSRMISALPGGSPSRHR